MSSYNQPRRGPNMNQYIANLNTLPANDGAAGEAAYANLEDELSLFTNVEFLNEFDLGEGVDGQGEALSAPQSAKPQGRDGFDESFSFPYLASDAVNPLPGFPGQATADFNVPYSAALQGQAFQPPVTPTSAQAGDKRPTSSSAASPSDPLEMSSRVAAEEDKRRRNTAASARFRVKKKQREQALERTAKEMTDRVDKLETRIGELEQENKFLRSLVVEKAGGSAGKEADVADALRKFAADTRKGDSEKKGVGTA